MNRQLDMILEFGERSGIKIFIAISVSKCTIFKMQNMGQLSLNTYFIQTETYAIPI